MGYPHLNDFPIPCFWWEGCPTTPTVIVAEDERYCRAHGRQAADMEARRFVMARDRQRCQRCGQGAHDTAHLIGRGQRYIRFEPDNLVALCRRCHSYLDQHPTRKREWVVDHFGDIRLERLAGLEAAGERRGGSVDLAAVIRGFREYGLTPEEMRTYRSGAWLHG